MTPPAPTGTDGIEDLKVTKWKDDHFEASWKRSGRLFFMFFDPLKMEAKYGGIDWTYADRSSLRRGHWSLGFPACRNMVPAIFRMIEERRLVHLAASYYLENIVSPKAMDHRRNARVAHALTMFNALETIMKVAGYGRPKGESFGLNERERMEIVQIASAAVTAVNTWRKGDKL